MVDSSILLRWILVIFMAFFLAIMLDNPDRNVRLVAALFLVVFAQIREISLVNDASAGAGKSKKPRAKKAVAKASVKRVFSRPSDELNSSEKDTLRGFVQAWQKNRG